MAGGATAIDRYTGASAKRSDSDERRDCSGEVGGEEGLARPRLGGLVVGGESVGGGGVGGDDESEGMPWSVDDKGGGM